MKFFKILPILMALNMNICFGSNFEQYRAFAEKKITGWINEAKSAVTRKIDKGWSKLEEGKTVDDYFKEINKSLYELVDIVLQPDSELRYHLLDEKLTSIDTQLKIFQEILCYYPVTDHIYWAEMQLLDINLANRNASEIVDRNHDVIKKYIKIWEEFLEDDSDD